MKTKIFAFAVMSIMMLSLAAAAEVEVRHAGIEPDSVLYGFDKAFDKISLAITVGDTNKIKKSLEIADERALETNDMLKSGKNNEANDARREHAVLINGVEDKIRNNEDNSINSFEDFSRIQTMIDNHHMVLMSSDLMLNDDILNQTNLIEDLNDDKMQRIRTSVLASGVSEDRLLEIEKNTGFLEARQARIERTIQIAEARLSTLRTLAAERQSQGVDVSGVLREISIIEDFILKFKANINATNITRTRFDELKNFTRITDFDLSSGFKTDFRVEGISLSASDQQLANQLRASFEGTNTPIDLRVEIRNKDNKMRSRERAFGNLTSQQMNFWNQLKNNVIASSSSLEGDFDIEVRIKRELEFARGFNLDNLGFDDFSAISNNDFVNDDNFGERGVFGTATDRRRGADKPEDNGIDNGLRGDGSVEDNGVSGKNREGDSNDDSSSGRTNLASAEAKAAGVIITGGVSGPGYPTGPLNLVVSNTQLFLDKPGQVNGAEVKDRQYENPLETIPPTIVSLPITINGVANNANEIKVISNIKGGQHSGTIDVDIDVLPAAGHLTLQYNGAATVAGGTITSAGTYKTAGTTGIFTGLVAEGTYTMTITESGNTVGSPASVSITTTSL